jgi:hypothetical protein
MKDYFFISHYGTIRINDVMKRRVLYVPSLTLGVHVEAKVNRVLIRISDDIRWEHIEVDSHTIELGALSSFKRLEVTSRILEDL